MTNKEIIQKVNDGFAAGDPEAILAFVADDVRWDVVGISTAIGKEEFRKEIKNEGFQGVPKINVTGAIEEGDRVAVEGTVQATTKDGQIIDLFFHNAYRLEDGKIKEMRSYLVFQK
jgi:ketosteroid isomerase-like protein